MVIAGGDRVRQPAWPRTAGGADLRENPGGPYPATVPIKPYKVEREGFGAPKMWEILGRPERRGPASCDHQRSQAGNSKIRVCGTQVVRRAPAVPISTVRGDFGNWAVAGPRSTGPSSARPIPSHRIDRRRSATCVSALRQTLPARARTFIPR